MKIKLDTLEDANEFASICGIFEEDIDLIAGRYIVDAKSYLGILSIGFSNPVEVIIHETNIKGKEAFYSLMNQWRVEE